MFSLTEMEAMWRNVNSFLNRYFYNGAKCQNKQGTNIALIVCGAGGWAEAVDTGNCVRNICHFVTSSMQGCSHVLEIKGG